MKTLKITLALIAIALLTVSGVQSDNTIELTDKEKVTTPTKIDLLAHGKKNKIKLPSNG